MKGGAAGGGYAQVVRWRTSNLHFTGDFNAIGLATPARGADRQPHPSRQRPRFDVRRIAWKRVNDMNDRALRDSSSPSAGRQRLPREDASTSSRLGDHGDLLPRHQPRGPEGADFQDRRRYTRDQKPILARDLKAQGAMTALLKDALHPNLVQTLENSRRSSTAAPFANIAARLQLGDCTRTALKLADSVVTRGRLRRRPRRGEVHRHQVPQERLRPDAVVIVATIRALKSTAAST